jgi:hypothetical protein
VPITGTPYGAGISGPIPGDYLAEIQLTAKREVLFPTVTAAVYFGLVQLPEASMFA